MKRSAHKSLGGFVFRDFLNAVETHPHYLLRAGWLERPSSGGQTMDASNIIFMHTSFTFASVIMMIMLAAIVGYMLWIKNKSKATQYLALFFAGLLLQSMLMFLAGYIPAWSAVLNPFTYVAIFLAAIPLVQFMMHFPKFDNPRAYLVATGIVVVLFLFALGLSLKLIFAPAAEIPNMARSNVPISILLPLGILSASLAFLSRAKRYVPPPPAETHGLWKTKYILGALHHPPNRDVHTLRNFSLALLVPLLPSLGNLIPLRETTFVFLTVFGVLLTIFSIALLFINHSPEPTTVIAKIVGGSLFYNRMQIKQLHFQFWQMFLPFLHKTKK